MKKRLMKRILACVFALAMIVTTLGPSMKAAAATAVADSITINDPIYDAVSGSMSYARAEGYGTGVYKSIVISFTSIRTNNEKATLPTSISGFNYATDLSNDSTYVINMPDGKTLPEVATYIRRIKFENCQNSSQKINFSIGKEVVKYMTLYSEDTGHYYQFIPFLTTDIEDDITNGNGKKLGYGTWQYAYYKSLSLTYGGLQGYLATVSSIQEDAFIYKCADEVGWLGGTRMVGNDLTTSSKGIQYYKSFTYPGSGEGIGYWYWASGPDHETNNGLFMDYWKGTYNKYVSNTAAGRYFNWNHKNVTGDNIGEPNSTTSGYYSTEGAEFCATTLKTGNGWQTSGKAGTITSSSPYYIAANYSWNDVGDTCWAFHDGNTSSTTTVTKNGITYSNKIQTYTCTGFFVEFGDAVTGLKEGTTFENYVIKTTTKAITHNWEYTTETSTNENALDTIVSYCTLDNPKCSYYGSATYHSTAISATLKTPDMAKNGSAYNLATFSGGTDLASATGGTLSSIKYYKATANGATSGGSALTEAPTNPGYYYAAVTITNSGTSNNTATAVSPFTIYDPSADYAVESINNKGSDANGNYTVTSGTSTISYKKVTGASDATSNLEVVLSTANDTLQLYKVADYTWTDGVLSEPTWVDSVQKWINTNSTYSAIAATPTKLSNESTSTWSSFYKDLLKSNDSVIAKAPTNGTVLAEAVMGTATGASYTAVSDTYHDADGNTVDSSYTGTKSKYSTTYENIKPGVYAVIAKNGSSTYAVTVAAITPQRTGPKSTYTLQTLYTVYIKQSEATLGKKINGLKEDAVGIDETVTFTIDFELPSYTDRASSSTSVLTKSPYTLALKDTMSSAYTINEGSIKLYYKHKDASNNDTQTLFYQTDADATTATSIPTHDNYLYYTNQVTGSTKVTDSDYSTTYGTVTDMVGKYAQKRTSTPIFDAVTIAKDSTSGGTSTQSDTTITINFDEPALRAWAKDSAQLTSTNSNDAISGYVLEYTAVVDKDAKVNSKDNYNKAALTVEDSTDGSKTKDIEDVVYGYTYGLKIVKIDGDSYGTDSQKYIAGAKFKLYKEVAAYSKSGDNYTFLGSTDKKATDSLISTFNIDTSSVTTETAQANAVIAAAKDDSSYYVYEQSGISVTGTSPVNDSIASFSKTDASSHVACTEGMNLTRVYKQVIISNGDMDSKGVITSVNTADGVTCHGLAEGTYILVESQAPIGYNELSEDMYFEINQLTSDEEQKTGVGSLQQFREDLADGVTLTQYQQQYDSGKTVVATYSTDALISLDVLNYAGLTLPSTGGIGILIFMIIGIAIMATVIVVLVIRRKNSVSYM